MSNSKSLIESPATKNGLSILKYVFKASTFPATIVTISVISFENVLKNNPQQDPQKVADAIAELIEKPKGEKPFRTPVDFLGMGNYIQKYNEHLEQIMTGLYTNFGTQGLLNVRK